MMLRNILSIAAVAVSIVSACDEDADVSDFHRFEFQETAPAARVTTWFRREGHNECCDFTGIQRWVFGKEETHADCKASCREWPRCVGYEREEDDGKSECVLLTVSDDDHFRSHVNTKACDGGKKRQCFIRSYFENWEYQEVYNQRCNFAGLNLRDDNSHKALGELTFTDCLQRCTLNKDCVAFDIKRSGSDPIGEQECTHYFAIDSEDPRQTLTWLSDAFVSSLEPRWQPYTCIMKQKRRRGWVVPEKEDTWCEERGWEKIVGGGHDRRL